MKKYLFEHLHTEINEICDPAVKKCKYDPDCFKYSVWFCSLISGSE